MTHMFQYIGSKKECISRVLLARISSILMSNASQYLAKVEPKLQSSSARTNTSLTIHLPLSLKPT